MKTIQNRIRGGQDVTPVPSLVWPRMIAWLLLGAASVLLVISLWTPPWSTQLPQGIRGVGPNTALCFLLVGIIVLGNIRQPSPAISRVLPKITVLLMTIPLLVLAQWSVNWHPPHELGGLLFNQPESTSTDGGWPGRMSQATAIGLAVLGLGAWIGRRANRTFQAIAAQLALFFVFVLGQIGLVGHLLGLVLFTSAGMAPAHLSLSTALALMLSAMALAQIYRRQPWFQNFYGQRADRMVFAGSTLLMGTVLLTGAVLSIGLLAKPGFETHQRTLSVALDASIRAFVQETHSLQARSAWLTNLRAADAKDGGHRVETYTNGTNASDHLDVDFQKLGDDASDLSSTPRPTPAWGIPLAFEPAIRLTWKDGWLLEVTQQVPETGQRVALRKRSHALDEMAHVAQILGSPVDVVICGNTREGVYCFPDKPPGKPFPLTPGQSGKNQPMGLALAGHSGVTQALDRHGRQAFLAYAPVGQTGLGMLWSMDAENYFSSLRQASWIAIMAILALSLVAAYLMHRYVRPVVKGMARAEAYLQTVMASAPDGLLTVDAAGRIASSNPAAESLFGLTTVTSLGQPADRFIPEWKRLLSECLTSHEVTSWSRDMESVVSTHTGKTVPVEMALRTFDFESERLHVVVIHDITERKAIQAQLAKVLHQTTQILQSAGEGIIGLDSMGVITWANPAALRILHFESQGLIGQDLQILLHGGHPRETRRTPVTCPIHDSLREGRIRRVDDAVLWNGEGLPVWVEYVSTPIWEGETPVGAVVVFGDITQRRLVEQELRDSEFRFR